VSSTPNFSATQVSSPALRDQLLILSLLKDARTAIPVQVMAVHPGTGNPPSIGTVDVQPLVQTVDGTGRLWNLGVTYGAPFCRAQAGNTAFVLDPAVNDIGLAVVCDRDISSVMAAAGLAAPGSARTHDISDLVYVLSIKSSAPITQYILANSSGITLLSPQTITIQGQQINLVGPVNANGATISDAGEVTDASGIVLGTHDHGPGTYANSGGAVGGVSGQPIP
jgi:hypothetical protein